MVQFNQLNQRFSRKLLHNGKSFLYFGGTAYLGIPASKKFQKLYQKGVSKFGLNNGTSRNNNIQLGIYDEAETKAAKRFGAESALITSSGYLAATLTVSKLTAKGEVRYAPNSHPALWLPIYPNVAGDFNDWLRKTVNEINQSKPKKWVIISNAMNNLFPAIYDFSPLLKTHPDKEITLIVDDSHGIGINNNGLSAISSLPIKENITCVIVASMAKALGVDAGLVLSSAKIIDILKQSDEFLGASPPSAAGLYAFMMAKDTYQKQHRRLMDNTAKLAEHLKGNADWKFVKGFPVFLTKKADIYQQLVEKGILISSFAYPNKNGEILNRIVLSSWHKTKDIERLKSIL